MNRRRILIGSASSKSILEPSIFEKYLTIVALEDDLTASFSKNNCEYCVDGDGDWKTLSAGTATEAINTGQILSFRGNLIPVSGSGIGTFTISKSCHLEGNCMSMLFGDDAASNTSLSGKDCAFFYLFRKCKTIKSVSSGFLPATTLEDNCYYFMFDGCNNLTKAPELPATTLADRCYEGMFYGCNNLIKAPSLPATTLADYCYRLMFSICTSLTQAPELPATTLADSCYASMFFGCKNLTTTPSLPATTLADYCYSAMFESCTSLTTTPSLPATKLASSCYYYMFGSCSSLTTAPELPATTLADSCYDGMFAYCTSLTQAPELPATTLATQCYFQMFRGCTSLTQAPELPATKLATQCYVRMFYGCSELNYIKMLATDISADSCLSDWVYEVASRGTFVKTRLMTTLPTGSSGIPSGWVVEDNITLTVCKSLTLSANDVKGVDTTTTVTWVALCEGIDDLGTTIEVEKTGTFTSDPFPQNTSTTETITRTISFTYMGVTATTTFVQDIHIPSYCNVDLNNNWQVSSINPDSAVYDSYESFSNKGIGNSGAIMYIDIFGYSTFKLYIRSNAESSYDYVMVSQLDKTITYSTSYSDSSLIKAHTRGNQQSGTALSNYKLVEFTNIDGGEHRISIIYRKDSSANSGTDMGYLLIPKQ